MHLTRRAGGAEGVDNPLYHRQRMAQEEGGDLGDESVAALADSPVW
jgi:hypothetical protein